MLPIRNRPPWGLGPFKGELRNGVDMMPDDRVTVRLQHFQFVVIGLQQHMLDGITV